MPRSLPIPLGAEPYLCGGCASNRRDTLCFRRLRAHLSPRIHQSAPLSKQVAAPIGCFCIVLYRVRQSHLSCFTREIGAFRNPIAEGGAKSMGRNLTVAHSTEEHKHSHVRQWLARFFVRKDIGAR